MVKKPQKVNARFVALQCLELVANPDILSGLVNVHHYEKPCPVPYGTGTGFFVFQDSSRERYCRASATCSPKIFSEPAKSAMVLDNFKTR